MLDCYEMTALHWAANQVRKLLMLCFIGIFAIIVPNCQTYFYEGKLGHLFDITSS